MATKLDKDNTKPAKTEAGDGPADTTDADERASSVTPNPGPEAIRAGTVNAVQPIPQEPASTSKGKERIEKFQATRPDGTTVTVTHNIDTGESKVS